MSKQAREPYTFQTLKADLDSNQPVLPFREPLNDTVAQIYIVENQTNGIADCTSDLKNNYSQIKTITQSINTHVTDLKTLISQDIANPQYANYDQKIQDLLALLQQFDKCYRDGEASFSELESRIETITFAYLQINATDSYITRYRKRKINSILVAVRDLCAQISMPSRFSTIQPNDVGSLRDNFYFFKMLCCKVLPELAKLQKAYLRYCRETHRLLFILKKTVNQYPEAFQLQNFFDIETLFPYRNKTVDAHIDQEYKEFARIVRLDEPTLTTVDSTKLPSLVLIRDRTGDRRGESSIFIVPVPPALLIAKSSRSDLAKAQVQANSLAAQLPTKIEPEPLLPSIHLPIPNNVPIAPAVIASRNSRPADPNEQAQLGKRKLSPTKRGRKPKNNDNKSSFKRHFRETDPNKITILQKEHQENRVFRGSPNFVVKYQSAQMNKFHNIRIEYLNYKKKDDQGRATTKSKLYNLEHVTEIALTSLKPDRSLPTSNQSETFVLPTHLGKANKDPIITYQAKDAASLINWLGHYSIPTVLFRSIADLLEVPLPEPESDETEQSEDADPFREGVPFTPVLPKIKKEKPLAQDTAKPSNSVIASETSSDDEEASSHETADIPALPITTPLPANDQPASPLKAKGTFDCSKFKGNSSSMFSTASSSAAKNRLRSESPKSTSAHHEASSSAIPRKGQATKAAPAKRPPAATKQLKTSAPSEQKLGLTNSNLRQKPKPSPSVPTA